MMPAKGGDLSRSFARLTPRCAPAGSAGLRAQHRRVRGLRARAESGRRRSALTGHLLAEGSEPPRSDRRARLLEQAQVEAQVVERGETAGQALAGLEQMAQVGARVARAGVAVAAGVGR